MESHSRILLPGENEAELRATIEQHIADGAKATLADVMALWDICYEVPGTSSTIIWLEIGVQEKKGWLHIVRPKRKADFISASIEHPFVQISQALVDGSLVEQSVNLISMPVFIIQNDNGDAGLIVIIMSDQGFIVTAYPVGRQEWKVLQSVLPEGHKWPEHYTKNQHVDTRIAAKRKRAERWEAAVQKGKDKGGSERPAESWQYMIESEIRSCMWAKAPGAASFENIGFKDCPGLSQTTIVKLENFQRDLDQAILNEVDRGVKTSPIQGILLFTLRPLELAYMIGRETGCASFAEVKNIEILASAKNLRLALRGTIEEYCSLSKEEVVDISALHFEDLSSSSSAPTEPKTDSSSDVPRKRPRFYSTPEEIKFEVGHMNYATEKNPLFVDEI